MRLSHFYFLIVLVGLSLLDTALFAQGQVSEVSSIPSEEAYRLAIADFEEGNFDAAGEKFQLLAKRGLISKELYLNLATTLEKQNEHGRSVLWLRRSLLINPGMAEPRQNLTFLKQKLGYLEFSSEGKPAFFRRLPPTLGDWIAMTGLWLVAICLAMAFLLPRYQDRRFRPLLFACLAAVLAFSGAWFSQYYARHFAIENFATITANGTTALTAPVPDAKTVIGLPPGSEVRILQESGPWTYVEIPGDIRGWLRNEQLAAVWPIAFR